MKGLWKASAVMASGTLISRALGLVREQVLAYAFGAGISTDAFLVAYRIPNLLRDLFAEGAFSAAFVPTFTEALHDSHLRAKRLLWKVFGRLALITGLITALFIVFAPELVTLMAPSYADKPVRLNMAIDMTRLMAPYFFFVSLGALFMGVLNSLKIFFIPSLASAFFNLVMIFSIVFLVIIPGNYEFPGVYAAGFGVVLGGAAQLLIQLPLILKRGFTPKDIKSESDPLVGKVFRKLGPGLIGFAATQVNLIVNTILATGTVAGAVSWLSYAFRLFQFPVGVLGVSLGNSNLVLFSERWKSGKREEAISLLKVSYETSWLVLAPATLLLYFFAYQGVHLVYERGMFEAHSTQMTAMALRYYALGLVFYGLYKICGPTLYALERPKVPVIASIVSIGVNILFCVSLVGKHGFQILSLGTSLSMFLNVIIQGIFLAKLLDLNWQFFLSRRLIKILLANGLLAVVTKWAIVPFVFHNEWGFLLKCLNLALCGIGFLMAYMLILLLFGEAASLKKFLGRFQKRT